MTSSDEPPDWDSPTTWADLATSLGIVTAGGALFNAWHKRRRSKRTERLEWGFLAAQATFEIGSVLNRPVIFNKTDDQQESEPPAIADEQFVIGRLQTLAPQIRKAQEIFAELRDPGPKEWRIPVEVGMSLLQQQLAELLEAYNWVQIQRAYQHAKPAEPTATAAFEAALRDFGRIRDELKQQQRNVRSDIARWLVACDAITADRLDSVSTLADAVEPDMKRASLKARVLGG